MGIHSLVVVTKMNPLMILRVLSFYQLLSNSLEVDELSRSMRWHILHACIDISKGYYYMHNIALVDTENAVVHSVG
jgi:hypothetical protein